MKLLTPGPVQLPREVLDALSKQPCFHRTEDFRRLLKEVVENLLQIIGGSRVVVMPGSGTTAVDAMVFNFTKPNDKAVVIVGGEFGERLADTLRDRGVEVVEYRVGAGEGVDLGHLEDLVAKLKRVDAIALVHNETSTGTTYRILDKLGDLAHSYGAKLLVDSVSGVPAEPAPMHKVDVLATASHKSLLSPPGVAIVALGEGAKPVDVGVPPSMKLSKYLKQLEKWETPFTPPVNLLYAMKVATRIILDIGVANYAEVHARRAQVLYSEIPLEPVPREEGLRSRTIAAFYTPISSSHIVELLAREGYVVARGMGELRDRVVRIGLMGDISEEDLRRVAELIREYVVK